MGPACPELPEPRKYLGRNQMKFVKKRLASSDAAWKVVANQLMIMRTYYPGGSIINFDSWMGYPTERRELVGHIKSKKIKDVVFITGDIHTFVAGDVRLNDDDKRAIATEFVGGSVSAPGSARAAAASSRPPTRSTRRHPGDHRPAEEHEPLGQGRRVRPSRLRARGGIEEGLPLHSQACGQVKTPEAARLCRRASSTTA